MEFSTNSKFHVNVSGDDVKGISDLNTEIYSIQSMGQSGNTYVGQRKIERVIEISGSYKATSKAEIITLRNQLSKILNSETGTLKYIYGTTERVITAIPNENMPNQKKQPIFKSFDLVFECPDPYWREPVETVEEIATWKGAFKFPLIIPQDTGIIMGYREPSLVKNIINNGDKVIGGTFEFDAIGTVENPEIIDIQRNESMRINATLQPGDKVIVTTGFKEKNVTLTRAGITTSFYDYWDVENNTYLQLYPGDNIFTYRATSGEENVEINIKKIVQYGSV